MNLCDREDLRALLGRHGFHFSKSMGQNFLIDPAVPADIAAASQAGRDCGVLEIGPGVGPLTCQLAQRAGKVAAVELDRDLFPILAETLAEFSNITIVNADVMKTDLAALIAREFPGMEVVVCANLPYYITSPILMALLEQRLPIRSVTVMVQKEAAQRICAPPGTRESGAISAAVWYYSQPRLLFPVSRGSFLPAPAVDSAVIRLDVRAAPPVAVANEALFFRVVRGAFGQRRKTILNTLSAALKLEKEQTRRIIEGAGVSPGARAEALTLEEFAAIAGQAGELLPQLPQNLAPGD